MKTFHASRQAKNPSVVVCRKVYLKTRARNSMTGNCALPSNRLRWFPTNDRKKSVSLSTNLEGTEW